MGMMFRQIARMVCINCGECIYGTDRETRLPKLESMVVDAHFSRQVD